LCLPVIALLAPLLAALAERPRQGVNRLTLGSLNGASADVQASGRLVLRETEDVAALEQLVDAATVRCGGSFWGWGQTGDAFDQEVLYGDRADLRGASQQATDLLARLKIRVVQVGEDILKLAQERMGYCH